MHPTSLTVNTLRKSIAKSACTSNEIIRWHGNIQKKTTMLSTTLQNTSSSCIPIKIEFNQHFFVFENDTLKNTLSIVL